MTKAREGLDRLMGDASMDAFRQMMAEGEAQAPIKSEAEPDIYLACFGTTAGQAVLADMYARYVHVTRAVPGQGADAAFYREGMAQVVFDIVDRMWKAREGE